MQFGRYVGYRPCVVERKSKNYVNHFAGKNIKFALIKVINKRDHEKWTNIKNKKTFGGKHEIFIVAQKGKF